jgi:antirestriction protein ArdC
MATRAPMTAAEAATFDRLSPANYATLAAAAHAHGCACVPYVDFFTFRRWRALGRHVRRGEHGIALPLVMGPEETETGETRTRPRFGT